MRIIEIAALSNGAHRNQTGEFRAIPDDWAVVPADMETENFPFGEVTVEERNGVPTVAEWIPGVMPEPEPTPEPMPEPDPTPTLAERVTTLEESNADMAEALNLILSGVTE